MQFTSAFIKDFIFQHYGIEIIESKKLPGDVDLNFKVSAVDSTSYIFKISPADQEIEAWHAQNLLLEHLQTKSLPFETPYFVKASSGQYILEVSDGRLARMQSWVFGKMLDDFSPWGKPLLQSWGKTLGHLSRALQDFNNPSFHKSFLWDPSNTLDSRERADFMKEEDKVLAQKLWRTFELEAMPLLSKLRKSVNYNDAHGMNLLISDEFSAPHISGVIDFGDAVYTHTINELAIGCAYAGMDSKLPIEKMCLVVQAYHSVFPIEEDELVLLYQLIIARLLITVANAAWGLAEAPENSYLQVSAQAAWTLLRQLDRLNSSFVNFKFREVCGLEPCPSRRQYDQWAKTSAQDWISPIALDNQRVVILDLSVASLDVGNFQNYQELDLFEQRISDLISKDEGQVGIGGYLEMRPFYSTDAYQVITDEGPHWRTTHLGLDLWSEVGTEVRAPLDGVVHSYNYNNANRDYGACVILEHKINEDILFFTLYGHLSLHSIEKLEIGQQIQQGETFAFLGDRDENGNWPPHLHFQVILDLFEYRGDFPGVAFVHDLEVYKSLCPDPFAFGMTEYRASVNAYEGLESTSLLSRRISILGRGMSLSYQNPLHMVRGLGQYLLNAQGRRFLDTCNNVAHVGHEHPSVVQAINAQNNVLNTNSRYLHKNIIDLAEALVATFPKELCVVHFVNSGSEANELAIRMAKTATTHSGFLAIEMGYHGNTNACIEVSSYKFDRKGGQGIPRHVEVLSTPDTFKGRFTGESAALRYAEEVDQKISALKGKGFPLAAFIGEPIMSCAGQIDLPKGYLKKVYEKVRAAGGICISDEVQVGLGRIGKHFWGFQHQEVIPDIVTIGKPFGNGFPIAAVVCTAQVAEAFNNGMEFFSTFGGNPVSMSAGKAVLDVISQEALQANALEIGDYLKQGLQSLMKEKPLIGDVRGQGLFLGVEFIENENPLLPATAKANYLVNRLRNLGILMSVDGPANNVIKIKPPMCFTRANADQVLNTMNEVMNESFMNA